MTTAARRTAAATQAGAGAGVVAGDRVMLGGSGDRSSFLWIDSARWYSLQPSTVRQSRGQAVPGRGEGDVQHSLVSVPLHEAADFQDVAGESQWSPGLGRYISMNGQQGRKQERKTWLADADTKSILGVFR